VSTPQITDRELARRLCEAVHPHAFDHLHRADAVPCGEHIRKGTLYAAMLTTRDGARELGVLLVAAHDAQPDSIEDIVLRPLIEAVRRKRQPTTQAVGYP
jgi:hypothetical protein